MTKLDHKNMWKWRFAHFCFGCILSWYMSNVAHSSYGYTSFLVLTWYQQNKIFRHFSVILLNINDIDLHILGCWVLKLTLVNIVCDKPWYSLTLFDYGKPKWFFSQKSQRYGFLPDHVGLQTISSLYLS